MKNYAELKEFEKDVYIKIRLAKNKRHFKKILQSVEEKIEQHKCHLEKMRLLYRQDKIKGEYLNVLHDITDELEALLNHVERKKSVRNWTSSDWQEWDFMTSNID